MQSTYRELAHKNIAYKIFIGCFQFIFIDSYIQDLYEEIIFIPFSVKIATYA